MLRPQCAHSKPGPQQIGCRCFRFLHHLAFPSPQVPLGVALAELSPGGVRALVSAAALLSAPEGLGAAVLLRRGMLAGALALLAPAHLHAVVRRSLGRSIPNVCSLSGRPAGDHPAASWPRCHRVAFAESLVECGCRSY